ncbi:leucine--tRNA ligase [Betaproteobacteria bacterium PRO7]|nr:leucine--tRNA ligase [Betaproteobacteria bacterium PRO7]
MRDKYAPAEVEAAAQSHWQSIDAYRARENDARFPKGKFYACSMLPYPSGKLHMGHVRNYTINDMMYRHLRMKGYNVLMPMGWDAFGLPAENAAIKNKVAPAKWTYENIAHMKRQMQAMGLAIDWSREIAACDPAYYKWNQWLFLKMLEKGIAYRKTQIVNWDPVDQTVLANEQVIDGRGWRTGALVEKREIPGYYLAITKYADELLEYTLDKLPGWPERVRLMQENWIGKSYGVNFGFPYDLDGKRELLRVFTTRADTIMGVTFVALAAEHPLATRLARDDAQVAAFVEECKRGTVMEADLATMEKKGVPTGFFVTHPLTGEKVEVWVGNYVLMGYGEGAVMGVPGHDERDFAFAKKYGLPIRQVIDWPARKIPPGTASKIPPGPPLQKGGAQQPPLEKGADARSAAGGFLSAGTRDADAPFDAAWQPWYADKDGVCVNSGKYDGLAYEAAVDAIAADLKAKSLGDKQVQWRLRDWGISRQRYWGTPIPIIHCADCGPVPVPEKDLPVVLPEDLVPDGSGNPLAKDERFLACTCPKCGKPARRETDTMDTFVDSAWYYMRYCSPDAKTMVDARVDYWMPMDQYIGGIEHAVLHLLYARFWTKVMRDLELVKFDEPFVRLLTQGMVLNHIWSRRNDKGGIEYFWPQDVTPVTDASGRIVGGKLADGTPVEYGGIGTMSKSKNNGVDPQDLIDKYGADTARLFVMFASPPEQTLEWSDTGVEGAARFLRRLWSFGYGVRDAVAAGRPQPASRSAARFELHRTLGQVNYDYERLQYNTVVSGAMKMLNTLEAAPRDEAFPALVHEGLGILLRVLSPVTPHIGHALWTELGYAAQYGDILDAPWPEPAADALAQDEIELVVQVNGKLRGAVRVPAQADKAAIEAAALADANVRKFVGGNAVKRVVVVPGKLVNVVV